MCAAPYHAAQTARADSFGNIYALTQTYPPARGHGQQYGKGHEAQSAKLDEQYDDDLTEHGELTPGIVYRKTRDAGGGAGCEKGVNKGDGLPELVCRRQAQ